VHNFSDVRAAIDVVHGGQNMLNNSIPSNPQFYQTGQHAVYNDSDYHDPMELHLIVNGKDS
jgi:hypothetical protein